MTLSPVQSLSPASCLATRSPVWAGYRDGVLMLSDGQPLVMAAWQWAAAGRRSGRQR